MTKVLATPGVYIEEKSAFPSSAVQVATAIPAFIGYTEKAVRGKKSLLNKPTRMTSFAEYLKYFGGAPKTTFTIAPDEKLDYTLTAEKPTLFYLFNSIRSFFANGGGTCYIVSVGDYSAGIKSTDLIGEESGGGIKSLLKEPEPSMLVIPDAVLMEQADCYSTQVAMLKHCGYDTESRFALLDVYDGHKERTFDETDIITKFREGVGTSNLAYGAAYYPWLETTLVQADELDYTHIINLDGLTGVLTKEVDDNVAADLLTEKRAEEIKAEIAKIPEAKDADINLLSQTLVAVSPMFKSILADLRSALNLMPPSATMAGIYTMIDNSVGVHQSPANVSVGSVIKPAVNLTSENQEDLNLPLTGKAINAIRTFPGKGVLVWGARTLDGNSQDWRYISVRRTVIMIEQSIKIAAGSYVFEPNVASTWANLKAMISNFLLNTWKNGALAGTSPEDAFSVDVGLGTTMTPVDILDGIMRITVKIAVTRPAEFIVITFQQQMQKS